MNDKKRKEIKSYIQKLEEIQLCLQLLNQHEDPECSAALVSATEYIDNAKTFLYQAQKHISKKNKIKIVEIPDRENHEGIHSVKVKLYWLCPRCGKPRGNVQKTRSYDGSLVLNCDGWQNSCGHIDRYHDVLIEALMNGLNKKIFLEDLNNGTTTK